MSAFATIFYVVYMLTLYGILFAFLTVSYILNGKSLSAIARRRGIEKPWLAWVPVGSDWLLGCISDQYRYVAHGQERNARSKLLRWSIAVAASVIALVQFIAILVVLMTAASEEMVLALAMLMIFVCYGVVAVGVFYSINYYKALFDLFRSCDPDKSLIYLMVGIFVSYPVPFFLYSCRNKDLGMPPRQEQLPEAE